MSAPEVAESKAELPLPGGDAPKAEAPVSFAPPLSSTRDLLADLKALRKYVLSHEGRDVSGDVLGLMLRHLGAQCTSAMWKGLSDKYLNRAAKLYPDGAVKSGVLTHGLCVFVLDYLDAQVAVEREKCEMKAKAKEEKKEKAVERIAA